MEGKSIFKAFEQNKSSFFQTKLPLPAKDRKLSQNDVRLRTVTQ